MLAATAVAQAIVVILTGSVALLADTIHNFTDALTAVPLLIAFRLGRRPANHRYTYGYHRAEDVAGLAIVGDDRRVRRLRGVRGDRPAAAPGADRSRLGRARSRA